MNPFKPVMNLFTRNNTKAGSDDTNVKASSGAITVDMLADHLGNNFTPEKAFNIETFYSCVRDKAETIGQLPVKLYETSRDNGRKRIMQGRTHRIFTQRPCEYMSMQSFLEMIVASYESNGAFYALPERNDRGSVMGFIPFANQRNVTPNMDVNGNVYYTYTTNDGKPVFAGYSEDLFIISMFTLDGYTPERPIKRQARLLGIAEAQDETYKNQTVDGITSQMALSTDQLFSDENAQERLREDFKKARGPQGKKHIPIFEQGLKPVSLSLSPKDAELLGNKQFTTNRICRMTRVPVHRVGVETGKSNSATLTELDEAYMRDSLNPILTKIEDEFNRHAPESYNVEFNRKQFYAGSPHRLVEAVEREVKGGLATVNEGRIDLGRETVEGGDVFGIDSNNVTYGLWTDLPKIQEQLYGRANNQGQNENTDDQGNSDEE
jgi:HK97 family phage portal protein